MKCPECQSSETRFREKRNNWICDKCDHVWPVEADPVPKPAEQVQLTAKLKLFLSYARGDDFDPAHPDVPLDRERYDLHRSWVARLYRDLSERGFEVWFDRVSLPSRNLTFHQEIRDAVQACDRLIFIVGPNAAKSDYVRQEWQFAWYAAEKIVTPILLRGQHTSGAKSRSVL